MALEARSDERKSTWRLVEEQRLRIFNSVQLTWTTLVWDLDKFSHRRARISLKSLWRRQKLAVSFLLTRFNDRLKQRVLKRERTKEMSAALFAFSGEKHLWKFEKSFSLAGKFVLLQVQHPSQSFISWMLSICSSISTRPQRQIFEQI